MTHYSMHCEGVKVGAAVGGQPKPIELKIIAFPDGKVNIVGPLTDKEFCLFMLDSAKKLIEEAEATQLVSSN